METQTPQKLKVVYGYSYFPSDAYGDIEQMALAYVNNLNEAGFDVTPFCLTVNPPNGAMSFTELDRRWHAKDKDLLEMYERLEKVLVGKDVLLNASGINLHPEFVEKLKVFTVFQCFDDPESSEAMSKPVAGSYDMCLVGNIAEVDSYKSWGVKRAEWVPEGVMTGYYDPSASYETIPPTGRDIDLFMMIDREFPVRKPRLDKLALAFPDADFYGKGWPKGYLPAGKEVEYLKRAKIGPNVHNSTGPINFRTFYLPANGVMQICDNKSHLGKIYELDKEVVGYDTIEECIDLCRYYLAHDDERRRIAAAGWKRCMKDYTEIPIFARNIELFTKYIDEKNHSVGYRVNKLFSRLKDKLHV